MSSRATRGVTHSTSLGPASDEALDLDVAARALQSRRGGGGARPSRLHHNRRGALSRGRVSGPSYRIFPSRRRTTTQLFGSILQASGGWCCVLVERAFDIFRSPTSRRGDAAVTTVSKLDDASGRIEAETTASGVSRPCARIGTWRTSRRPILPRPVEYERESQPAAHRGKTQ